MAAEITQAYFAQVLLECGAAIRAQDWETAHLRYAEAQVIHAGFKKSVEDEQTRMERQSNLNAIGTALASAQAATGGSAAGSNQVSFTRGIPR